MNSRPSQQQQWSLRRWGVVIAAITAAQVVSFALLSGGSKAVGPSALPVRNVISLLTSSGPAASNLEVLAVSDPASAALVSPHGFSGQLWVSLPKVEAARTDLIEPHRWLRIEQATSLTPSSALASQADIIPVPLSRKPPLSANQTGATKPALANSKLRLEGGLQRRNLLNAPALPVWEYNDVLLPTTVQVLVDEQGRVLNATLLSRSGLAAADQRALELARGLTFSPAVEVASGLVEWGTLTFLWVTCEPAPAPAAVPGAGSTNTAPRSQ